MRCPSAFRRRTAGSGGFTRSLYVFKMLKPVSQDGSFLADVEAARQESLQLHVWWLGQSGFLVQWQDRHLLLDPYLSDSLTQKYAATDKPHARMTERVVAPDQLGFIDVVTSSHNHTDHLDAETLRPLIRANPKMTLLVPEANRGFVADRLQVEIEFPRGIEAGQTKTFAGFTFHGVPSAHNTREKDEWGRDKHMGYVVECGPWKIYHSGDTLWFPGLEECLRPLGVDVALLPINGASPERRVAGNLDGKEAARLAFAIGAHVVIPCHFDMFAFNTASPADFLAECQRLGQSCKMLRNGERWTSPLAPP